MARYGYMLRGGPRDGLFVWVGSPVSPLEYIRFSWEQGLAYGMRPGGGTILDHIPGQVCGLPWYPREVRN